MPAKWYEQAAREQCAKQSPVAAKAAPTEQVLSHLWLYSALLINPVNNLALGLVATHRLAQ